MTPLRPACSGSEHVIPVPPRMTVIEAWAEITIMGELHPYEGTPTWTTVRCPGGHGCCCRHIDGHTAALPVEVLPIRSRGERRRGWRAWLRGRL